MKIFWIAVLTAMCGLVFLGVAPEALATAAPAFPEHRDIGITPFKGNMRFARISREYAVTGGGANMWLKQDAFQFVYTQVSGDVMVTADVQFLGEGKEPHRKAALMIRQSLDPDSAYADVALHGDGLTALQYRATAGADTEEMRSDLKAPVRIRIERRGSQFTIAAGSTNDDLQRTGPVTVEMKDPVYVGLAVCSHNANVLETAIFRSVALQLGDQQ